MSRKCFISAMDVESSGFNDLEWEVEYWRCLKAPVQHRPTFPNMVLHMKPNFPTMDAAKAGERESS